MIDKNKYISLISGEFKGWEIVELNEDIIKVLGPDRVNFTFSISRQSHRCNNLHSGDAQKYERIFSEAGFDVKLEAVPTYRK